jgi:hypothetical protein
MPEEIAIGAAVVIVCSGETGNVIGRAEYAELGPQLLVRYKAADGRAVEKWWAVPAVCTPGNFTG